MTAERRHHKRLNLSLPVTLRYKGRLIPATALNISCGGMCLSTDHPEVTEDGNAEVIFDLSTELQDISVQGRVIHVKEGEEKQVGIQFTNLYSLGYQAIERYIRKNTN